MTADELQALLERALPARDRHGVVVEEAEDQDVRLRFPFAADFVGPGEIFSGPLLLSFADTAVFAAAVAATGGARLALTSTLNATFLRPAQPADTLAIARVIRRGRASLHAEAWLFSHAVVDPVLHATATCVLRDP
ncbi:MAG: PaaI family thioesterase [Rhodospirillales bacterium]|nr:MAG: PaaI family thioesterase [Rhodospirillales bacterium]